MASDLSSCRPSVLISPSISPRHLSRARVTLSSDVALPQITTAVAHARHRNPHLPSRESFRRRRCLYSLSPPWRTQSGTALPLPSRMVLRSILANRLRRCSLPSAIHEPAHAPALSHGFSLNWNRNKEEEIRKKECTGQLWSNSQRSWFSQSQLDQLTMGAQSQYTGVRRKEEEIGPKPKALRSSPGSCWAQLLSSPSFRNPMSNSFS
jgi:hypothetical protein